MKLFKPFCAAILLGAALLLSACGGGGSSGSGNALIAPAPTPTSTPKPTPATTQSHSVGGTITGLGDESGLALHNGLDYQGISPQATSFSFAHPVAQGASYSVTIASRLPSGRRCEIINGDGIVGSAAVQSVIVRCDPQPPAPTPTSVSTLATGFSSLVGIVTDGAGNGVAGDTYTISKISATGVTTPMTDPYGLPLRTFSALKHVSADKAGNVYAVDASAIWKISPTGVLTFLVQLPDPVEGIAVDGAGTVYMVTNNTIQKLAPGRPLTTLAGGASTGSADGAAADARFNTPKGLAVDASDNVYVADFNNSAVRKISPQGQVTTLQFGTALATSCSGFGGCSMNAPTDIAVDVNGNLYVAVRSFSRYLRGGFVDYFAKSQLLKYAADGRVSTLDIGVAGGEPLSGLAVDGAGTLYLAGSTSKSILKVRP